MEDPFYFSETLKFPAPWEDYVSKKRVPITLPQALAWCEHVACSNQLLYACLKRLVSYFVSDIEVEGVDYKERENIKDFLYNTLYIDTHLTATGLDYIIYGNSFTSLFKSIERSVICPKCAFSTNLLQYTEVYPEANLRYDPKNGFQLKCNRCGYTGTWKVVDRVAQNKADISFIRWNPHDMYIVSEPFSGTATYYWRVSPEHKASVLKNIPLHLSKFPQGVLECCHTGADYRFDKDSILHLSEPAPAGFRMQGWGLSPLLASFRQIWYIEVLRTANQAMAQDYIVPIRLIAPDIRSTSPELGDPMLTLPSAGINAQLQDFIRQWRHDPTSWLSLPFPVRYQLLGGEANRLIPYQLIDQAMVDLVAGLGIPLEFYKQNLTITSTPIALRVFEGVWGSLTKVYNRVLRWVAAGLSSHLGTDSFQLRMAKPSHVDDINRQMAKLQLALSGAVSMTTGLKSIGLDAREEVQMQLEEEKEKAEKMQQLQQEMEVSMLNQQLGMQQQGMEGGAGGLLGMLGISGTPPEVAQQQAGAQPTPGTGGAGGMPGAAARDPVQALLASVPEAGMNPVTPTDLINSAQSIAQQLYAMHPSLRISALRRLQTKNRIIHALAIQELETLNQQAALQGKVQAQQQAQQQAQVGPMV